jgi:ribosome-associated toxin RatA of RatAB toxin-antitoxin module
MKIKNVLIFTFITPLTILGSNLEFPDSTGKIVGRSQEYVIRLVETPGRDFKTGEALFLVKGSPIACYKVISDFKHYPEFMPNVRFAEFVGKKDSCVIYRFNFRVGLTTVRYSNIIKQRSLDNGDYTITWGYVNGDLKENFGSWDIAPYHQRAGYSIVRYKVFIDIGMFMPCWVRDLLMTKSIPKMIKAIGKRVEMNEAR